MLDLIHGGNLKEEEHFLNKDMRGTLLKMFILRRVSKDKINSYALLKELNTRKIFKRFSGTSDMKNEVYNAVNSLEKSGYIKASQKIENGRLKNYYTLTKKGDDVLKSAKNIFKKHLQSLSSLLVG